jgi:hypothetical protein
MAIPREGLNTPVESIGTWASHRDEDVLRTTPKSEGVEPVRNALAYHEQWLAFTLENGTIL